jgi:SAM-dependent methyltransferase
VGGTLFYLAQQLDVPLQAVGLTISPLQAHLAHERAGRLALPQACLFAEADFLAVPIAGNMDVAISVEAYVHAVDPDCFLAEAARILRPGGKLILCDDFLSARTMSPFLSDAERHWVLAYQQGWHIPNLCGEGYVQDLARSHGFTLVSDRDLTPHLRLRTLPDLLATALLAAGHRLPICHTIVPSMTGSLALQHCLKLGLVQYRFLVFEKQN